MAVRAVDVAVFLSLACCATKTGQSASGAQAGPAISEVRSISRIVVAEVAHSQGTPGEEARRAVARDVCLSEAALARGLASKGEVSWAATTALARAELGAIWHDANADGEVRASELEKLRVIHFVVRKMGGQSADRLRDIAAAARHSLVSARTAEEFASTAGRFVTAYPGTRVETLAPFDATGASDDGGGVLDADFVAAAYELRQAGDTSEVTETPFGWHTIRLVERIRPQSSASPAPEYRDAVFELRARQRIHSVVGRLRKELRLDVSAGAEAEMARAVVGIL
jgi:hypothetical protein